MSAPAATRSANHAEHKPAPAVSQDAALLTNILDRETEFVPFMGKDPIKLSARLVMKFLCTRTKSGETCDERMAIRFVMMCKARGLNPWEGDAYIIGFDGKDGPQFSLVTAHQAFLKRAEVHPEYDGMTSGVIVMREGGSVELEGDYFDEGDGLVGGWACVHFKTRKHPMKKRLKLATFHQGRSRWNADPAGMIVKCAEADALRSAFPNTLGGMYLDDEMPEAKHIEPSKPTGREPVPMPRAIGEGNGHPSTEQIEKNAMASNEPSAASIEDGDSEDLEATDRKNLADAFQLRLERSDTHLDLGALKTDVQDSEEQLGEHYAGLIQAIDEKKAKVGEGKKQKARA